MVDSSGSAGEVSPERFAEVFAAVREQVARTLVGQDEAVEHLLAAIFSGGHVLLTGMPGLGRTLLVKSLAQILGLTYSRLQFTPDLLPTDIVGTEVLEEDKARGTRHFRFFKGPVFANLVLADEVNRSPARTQAALLEVMQEHQATVGGTRHAVPLPFIIIATENTLETEGVWPMPEAQVDRFMMSIQMRYPTPEEEVAIIQRTTGTERAEWAAVTEPAEILAMQRLAAAVPVAPAVKQFAVDIARASRPGEAGAMPGLKGRVRLGGSPRAAQGMLLAGKVLALARGRSFCLRRDIAGVALPILAHRLILDYRASAHGLTVRHVVAELIDFVQSRAEPPASRRMRALLRGRMALSSRGGWLAGNATTRRRMTQ